MNTTNIVGPRHRIVEKVGQEWRIVSEASLGRVVDYIHISVDTCSPWRGSVVMVLCDVLLDHSTGRYEAKPVLLENVETIDLTRSP